MFETISHEAFLRLVPAATGLIIAVVGAVAGTREALRHAKSAREREFILQFAMTMCLGVGIFTMMQVLSPHDALRILLWAMFGPVLIQAIRRYHEEIELIRWQEARREGEEN